MSIKKLSVSDQETGELLGDIPILVYPKAKVQSEYVMLWQKSVSRLCLDTLRVESRRILDFFLGHCDFGNEVPYTQKQIADELGLKPSAVSRSIKELLDKRYIMVSRQIGTSKLYMLDPDFAWKGSVASLKKFWETLDRPWKPC